MAQSLNNEIDGRFLGTAIPAYELAKTGPKHSMIIISIVTQGFLEAHNVEWMTMILNIYIIEAVLTIYC